MGSDGRFDNTASERTPNQRLSDGGNATVLAGLGAALIVAGSAWDLVGLFLQIFGVFLLLPAVEFSRQILSSRFSGTYSALLAKWFNVALGAIIVSLCTFAAANLARLYSLEEIRLIWPWDHYRFRIVPEQRTQVALITILFIVVAFRVLFLAWSGRWRLVARLVCIGFLAILGSGLVLLGSSTVHGCLYFADASQCSAFWTTSESRTGFSLLGVYTLLIAILMSRYGLGIVGNLRIKSNGLMIVVSLFFLVSVSQLLTPARDE